MAGRNVFRFEGILSHDGIDEKSKRTSDDPAEKRDLYPHGGATEKHQWITEVIRSHPHGTMTVSFSNGSWMPNTHLHTTTSSNHGEHNKRRHDAANIP